MAKKPEFLEYGDRLRNFIDAQYHGSQKSLADALNVAESNFSKYVNGFKKYSNKASLERLKTVGLNPEWYLSGEGEMKYVKSYQIGDTKVNLPIYESPVHELKSGVIKRLDDLLFVTKQVTILQRYLDIDKLFGFKVTDKLMLGAGILPGDLLICSTQMTAKNGSTVIANINGCIMVNLLKNNKLYSVPNIGSYEETKGYQDNNGSILGVVFKIERDI